MHDVAQEYRLTGSLAGKKVILQLKDVSFIYPDGNKALDNVNLAVYENDRLAIVGHNGCGKTTLAKILCDIYKPTRGSVLRENVRVGMVFQDPDDQLFSATLFDDLAFGPLLMSQGITVTDATLLEAKISTVLDMVGLREYAYKEPHNLSYGQRKRAALATVLTMDPDVLILDEPTDGLDPEHEEVFLDLLSSFKGTLVCISHNLFFLYHLCDRVLVLKNGRVHHDYTIKDLISHPPSLREHGLDFTFRLSCCGNNGGHILQVRTEVPASSEDSPIIYLNNVSYTYPDGSPGLKNVSLVVHKGERIAVVGENGAGKSTLALVLTGILKPLGDYYIDAEIGLVFQNPMDQLFCTSCWNEVAFGPENMDLARDVVSARVKEALHSVGLDGYENRVPHRLSGGEQKRIAIASILSMKPDVLILDEPTNNLDPDGERQLIEILDSLEQTLIIISHDLCFLSFLCDRAVVMHEGRIIEDVPFEELFRAEFKRAHLHHHHGHHKRCCQAIREIFFGGSVT